MTERYFEKFQTIEYENIASINITQRTALANSSLSNPFIYYQLDNTGNMEADAIADKVYGDSYLAWLIYYGNGIIDPYYQWYVDSNSLNEMLKKKYNVPSVMFLYGMVAYYKNNWESGGRLQLNAYDALPDSLRRYWQPEYGEDNDLPLYFTRVQANWTSTTNEVVSFTANGSGFIKNEPVTVTFSDNSTGTGQVAFSSNTNLIVQHTRGYVPFAMNNTVVTGLIVGSFSGTNTSFTNVSLISKTIPDDEYVYWTPISIFDYETAKNEKNRSYKLVQPAYAASAAKQLKALLK